MVKKPTNTYQRLTVSYVINIVYRPNNNSSILHGAYHTHNRFTLLQYIYIYIYIYIIVPTNVRIVTSHTHTHTHIILTFLDGDILHPSNREYRLHS